MDDEIQRNDGTPSFDTKDSVSIMDEDDKILVKMGYKQELYRGFNGFMRWGPPSVVGGRIAPPCV